MSSENREMLEDELAQDFFPDLDVTAIEKVTLVHDAGDDVWIAGHGGATGRDAEKAGAIEALAVALRERGKGSSIEPTHTEGCLTHSQRGVPSSHFLPTAVEHKL